MSPGERGVGQSSGGHPPAGDGGTHSSLPSGRAIL